MGKSKALIFFLAAQCVAAWAWDDHDQLTWLSIMGEPYAGDRVIAEELTGFLEAEKAGLAGLLDELEAGFARSMPGYPARPPALALDPSLSGPALAESFSRAIRVNPGRPFILFLQPLAGEARAPGETALDASMVDAFESRFPNPPFVALAPGSAVPAARVVATASDEPDYGMDLGLYEDNGTAHGREYGFGSQPFGNPALIYGSQAPFHMSFPREDPVIKLAAGFVGRGLAAYRVELYTGLARYAMRTGHAYWAYRFAGWALHYLQDLSQPYHARLMPGRGTAGMLALYALGSQAEIDGAVVLLSNRHLMIEDYAYRIMATWSGDRGASPLFAALEGGTGSAVPAYRAGYAYDVIAKAAYDQGPRLDRLIAEAFPARLVSDPAFDFGAAPVREDSLAALRRDSPERARALESFLSGIYADLGGYARAYLAYVRDPSARLPPRKAPADPRAAGYILALAILLSGLALLAAAAVRRRKARRKAR